MKGILLFRRGRVERNKVKRLSEFRFSPHSYPKFVEKSLVVEDMLEKRLGGSLDLLAI